MFLVEAPFGGACARLSTFWRSMLLRACQEQLVVRKPKAKRRSKSLKYGMSSPSYSESSEVEIKKFYLHIKRKVVDG